MVVEVVVEVVVSGGGEQDFAFAHDPYYAITSHDCFNNVNGPLAKAVLKFQKFLVSHCIVGVSH